MNHKNNRLDSLQTVRCIAFIIIFLSHSGVINDIFGGAGVSIFLVLSGFIMQYAYWDRKISYSTREGISFSINKIKKLYPLHICTMLSVIILDMPGFLHTHIIEWEKVNSRNLIQYISDKGIYSKRKYLFLIKRCILVFICMHVLIFCFSIGAQEN